MFRIHNGANKHLGYSTKQINDHFVLILLLTNTLVPVEMGNKTHRTFALIAAQEIGTTVLTHEAILTFIRIHA